MIARLRGRGALVAVALLSLAQLCLRAPWPEGYDAVGLVASADRFDLARFEPHPPGYPVYVALLRVVHLVAHDAVAAATLLSWGSSLLAMAAAARLAPQRAAAAALVAGGAPGLFRASTQVGTEAPALSLGLVAAALVSSGRGLAAGVAAGLAVGVRLSWAPALCALLLAAPRGQRLRFAGGFVGASAAWLLGLRVAAGPRLFELVSRHADGHFTTFGRPASLPLADRALLLCRDVLVDGVGLVGCAALLVCAAVALRRRPAEAPAPRRRAVAAAIGSAAYTLWLLLGQNVGSEPRHALPLVAALLLAGCALSPPPLAAALAAAVTAEGAAVAVQARLTPPAAVQLAAHVATDADTLVYAGRSARLAAFAGARCEARATMGDVIVDLSRRDALPARVLVTSELAMLSRSPFPLGPPVTFCRPPRLDRRHPCITMHTLEVPR